MQPEPPIIDVQESHPPLVPLEKIPYPVPVLILAAVTVLAFLVGLVRTPHSLSVGIQAEHGAKALAAGNPQEAAVSLKKVLDEFPEARDVRLDYLDACLATGNLKDAFESLDWFDGKKVSKEEEERLNGIQATFQSKIDAFQKDSKVPGQGGE